MPAPRIGLIACAVIVTAGATVLPPAAWAGQASAKDFNPSNFPGSPATTNKFWPLVPGTKLVLQGSVQGGGGLTPHTIISIVTDLTKVVDGVKTRVLWDRDLDGNTLSESELFFSAEDDDGNVWLLGEYPELYQGTKFLGAPSTFIAGVDGALPGISMRANPQTRTSSYSEGKAPEVGFDDVARVSQTGTTTCVPLQCYSNVLVIDEWAPNAPKDGHQLKYYATGVGNVRVTPQGGQQQEELVLVEFSHLSAADMAAARREALKLDARAYRVAEPYRGTPPAQPPS